MDPLAKNSRIITKCEDLNFTPALALGRGAPFSPPHMESIKDHSSEHLRHDFPCSKWPKDKAH